MASKVYFSDLRAKNPHESKISKIQRLFDEAGFVELLGAEDLTAIKIHFGEYGNDGYINPVFVRQVVDKIRQPEQSRLSRTQTPSTPGAGIMRLTT